MKMIYSALAVKKIALILTSTELIQEFYAIIIRADQKHTVLKSIESEKFKFWTENVHCQTLKYSGLDECC